MKFNLLFLTFLFLKFTTNTFAANEIKINFNDICSKVTSLKQNDNILRNFSQKPYMFTVDPAAQNIFRSAEKLTIKDFPISNTAFDKISLKRATSVVDESTLWFEGRADGIYQVQGPSIESFEGNIDNEPGSRIYLNYTGGSLYGLVIHSDSTQYSITPETKSGSDIQMLYQPDAVGDELNLDNYICGTDDHTDGMIEQKDIKTDKDMLLSTNLLKAEIAVEAEYYYYELLGSNYDKAAEYIAQVMSLASRIYEENVNVTLHVPYVLIWDEVDGDPYANYATLSQKLWRMPNAWKQRSVNRSIAVLFANLSRQPAGNVVAGISMGGQPYRGSLCNANRGYCVFGIRGNYKYPTVDYTWDINVSTHEMGHNFSAPHTHNCFWEPNMIDTCVTKVWPYEIGDACIASGQGIPRPGTIMSYCHISNGSRSVQLYFHDREKPLIRRAADQASCVTKPDSPMLKLLEPLGGKKYEAKKIIPVRWTYNNLQTIDLKYSYDLGESWVPVIFNQNVKDSIYNWKAPNISEDSVLFLIKDAFSLKYADTSVVPFSILIPAINYTTVLDGKKFGKGEKLTISWEKILVNTVKLGYSSDGGKNWTTLETGNIGTSFTWILPDVASDEYKFRITAEDKQNVIAESRLFGIGDETAHLISPNGGEHWCVGDTNTIRWEAEYVTKFWLYYTTNGGEKWRKVFIGPVDSEPGKFRWRIPNRNSDSVKVRIVSYVNNTVELDASDSFLTIDSCTVDVPLDGNVPDGGITILKLLPDPASDHLKIETENQTGKISTCSVKLVDIQGNLVEMLENSRTLNPGTNTFRIPLNEIPQGRYFIVLETETGTLSKPFNIIR